MGIKASRWNARLCGVLTMLLLLVCSSACLPQTADPQEDLKEQDKKAQAFIDAMWWSNWKRLPTDAEINAAKDAALKSINSSTTQVLGEGEVSEMRSTTTITVTSSTIAKMHRTDIEDPLAANGVVLRVTSHYVGRTEYPNSALYRNKPSVGESDQYHVIPLKFEDDKWVFSGGHTGRSLDEVEEYMRTYWRNPVAGWLPVDAKSPDSPDQPKTPWKVVVGGVAAVSAAAAAVAAAKAKALGGLATAKPDAGNPNQPPKPLQYILQLSTKKLSLSPDKPAQLSIKAWKVGADGGLQPAPEAAIKLTVAPGMQGVSIAPNAGQGEIICAISVAGEMGGAQGKLDISASAGGSHIGDSVELEIDRAYKLEFF